MTCYVDLQRCGRAVARWTLPHSGTPIRLCKKCLDFWLDNADADDDLEPLEIKWLTRSTS